MSGIDSKGRVDLANKVIEELLFEARGRGLDGGLEYSIDDDGCYHLSIDKEPMMTIRPASEVIEYNHYLFLSPNLRNMVETLKSMKYTSQRPTSTPSKSH